MMWLCTSYEEIIRDYEALNDNFLNVRKRYDDCFLLFLKKIFHCVQFVCKPIFETNLNSFFYHRWLFVFTIFHGISSTPSFSGERPCKNFGFYPSDIENVTHRCTVWSDDLVPEICSAGTQSRLRILKHVFLFPELQPLSLFELFAVGLNDENSWPLRQGEKGSDCIFGTINRCTTCFKQISGILRKLNRAYQSFDTTLSRFDCLPAIDAASATRPFSPNATCTNCKVWYRRWLLVHSLGIWKRGSCINWCYYTQLACPHLAPAKLWDYAGHPSFQCRDMDIDSWRHECDCIHPCDVRGIVAPGVVSLADAMELTLIARSRDGLILATSIEGNNDQNNDSSMVKYSNQAKMLFKKLAGSPAQQSVETGPFVFHYIVTNGICALVLCDHSFSRKTAFQYLHDISSEFLNSYGTKIEHVVRPYHFLDFDKYIQQAKIRYTDNSKYAINAVSNELQDVTRIMVTNIEDVIHRGEALNILENRASELSGMSKKYRDDAKALNRRSTIFKVAVSIGVLGFIFLIARFMIF